jgi:hypothetical protein
MEILIQMGMIQDLDIGGNINNIQNIAKIRQGKIFLGDIKTIQDGQIQILIKTNIVIYILHAINKNNIKQINNITKHMNKNNLTNNKKIVHNINLVN